jgi:hypothetical protein
MSFSDRFRRTATARGKAELADMAADHAREDLDIARTTAKQFAPDFQQPGNVLELVTRYNIAGRKAALFEVTLRKYKLCVLSKSSLLSCLGFSCMKSTLQTPVQ